MTPTQAFVAALVVAIVPIVGTAVAWIFGRGSRRIAGRIREHDQWMDDAKQAYERAEKRAANAEQRADRIEEKCEQCNEKLDRVLGVLYGLIEDVEEQIIPAMMLPHSDPRDTRNAMRAALRRAREAVSAS